MGPSREEFESWARFFISRREEQKEQTGVTPTETIGYTIAVNIHAFEKLNLPEETDRISFSDELETQLIHRLNQKSPDALKNSLKGYGHSSAWRAIETTALPITSKNPYERMRAMAARAVAHRLVDQSGIALIYSIGSFVKGANPEEPIIPQETYETLTPLFQTLREDLVTARTIPH